MTSLLILAVVLLALWLWGTWKREGAGQLMATLSYVPLVGAVMCVVMALGLWVR
ncbi:MAG: hypothetical protein JWO69_1587 [Thermoleophilia bacterium]|jgi:hypothetical protein|nr:hypothetical protein [Thermoleophilia bacterium]